MRSILLLVSLLVWMVCRSQATPPYQIQDILTADSPSASRSEDWKPADGLALEVSGMDFLPDGRLAVAIRKGEVWLLDNVLSGSAADVTYQLFATGLHEPLGVECEGADLLVTQRAEVTRLRDTDADGVADEYLTAGNGWHVSGSYHGYAYGPRSDGQGRHWVTLNLDMGDHADNSKGWRGWGGIISQSGRFVPMVAGMRSPCGLGANIDGDMFCVDQQGNWIPTTPIYHLREGAYFLNPDGIGSQNSPGSSINLPDELPDRIPYPEAVRTLPQMTPPAVWLPYNKMGRSGTDLAICDAGGKFGPFDGQFMVAEFTDAKVSRVFLEKVRGDYQGAAFPFLSGFASGIVRLRFAPDGSLMVGMTSRGWSSLGTKAYGLQRVQWTGTTPFAIQEMRAKPDGFELVFTHPVDPSSAINPDSYSIKSYTYFYSSAYGSAEIDTKKMKLTDIIFDQKKNSVRLKVDGLRELYVHELSAHGIRSRTTSAQLDHPHAYYTLNRIPDAK